MTNDAPPGLSAEPPGSIATPRRFGIGAFRPSPCFPAKVDYSMSLAGVPHSDRKRAQTDIAAWTAMPGRILSVAARFPLYKTAAAHKAVEAGGKVGTVVVEPQR